MTGQTPVTTHELILVDVTRKKQAIDTWTGATNIDRKASTEKAPTANAQKAFISATERNPVHADTMPPTAVTRNTTEGARGDTVLVHGPLVTGAPYSGRASRFARC